jgi:hypothetical protein
LKIDETQPSKVRELVDVEDITEWVHRFDNHISKGISNDYYRGTELSDASFDLGSSSWDTNTTDGSYPIESNPISTDIDDIIDVLRDGVTNTINPNATPSWTVPDGFTGGYLEAARIMVANRAFIQAETMAWIDTQSPGVITGNDTLTAKCKRDVGYLLESWASDLATGGTTLSQRYASYYANGTVLVNQNTNQIDQTIAAIQYMATLVKAVAKGTPIAQSYQRRYTRSYSSVVPETGLLIDPVVMRSFTIPGNGSPESRQWIVTASDQAFGYSADHILDQNTDTSYRSAKSYRNFNGTLDAEDVYIDIECPTETMIVAYSFTGINNLKKWELQARCTPYTAWESIDVGGVPREIDRTTDATAIDTAVRGLLNAFTDAINTGDGERTIDTVPTYFSPAVTQRQSGYIDAAYIIAANRTFIQEETMEWVNTMMAESWGNDVMTDAQRVKCKRDVGYIVDAVVNDLLEGGALWSIDYAKYYLRGAVLPANQVGPTIESIQYVRDLAILCGTKTRVTPNQTHVPQSFVGKQVPYISTSTQVYRTTATTKYSYYRLKLLQNTDNDTFRLGALVMHEFERPRVLVDGPPVGDTRIERIEIQNGGSGYDPYTSPKVTITNLTEDNVIEEASATATIDGNGSVTAITLDTKVTDSVQRIEVDKPGSGYRSPPIVNVDSSPGTNATAKAFIDKNGTVTHIEVIDRGDGYTGVPGVSIVSRDPGQGSGATADAYMTKGVQGGKGYASGAIITIADPDTGSDVATAIAIMNDDYCDIECPIWLEDTELNIDDTGRLKKLRLIESGSGYYTETQNTSGDPTQKTIGLRIPPTVSIQPPIPLRPVVVASPYIQNCSNIGGPILFNEDRSKRTKVPATLPLPFDVNNVFGNGEVIDEFGAGGGCRIDGNACAPYSSLRSFVMDAFTQVNGGNIGFLLTMGAYAQAVSTFGTFAAVHFACLEGSFLNASNSVTDFGLRGLVARGKSRFAYLTGRAHTPYNAEEDLTSEQVITRNRAYQYLDNYGYRSKINKIDIVDKDGFGNTGYTLKPEVKINHPDPEVNNTDFVKATASIDDTGFDGDNGTITEIRVDEQGSGYKNPPTIEFVDTEGNPAPITDQGERAATEVVFSGVSRFRLRVTDSSQRPSNPKPDVTSLVRIHGLYYTVVRVSSVVVGQQKLDGYFDVTITGGKDPLPRYIDANTIIEFYAPSYLSTGSHVFEYAGSYDQVGVTYNALPQFGGVSAPEFQIVEENRGKVFYTSSDHLGNYRVGESFRIDQATGAITFNLENADLDLTGVKQIQFQFGDVINEFSNNPGLISSSGTASATAAASQLAIQTYIRDKRVPLVNKNVPEGYVLRVTDNNSSTGYDWGQINLASAGVTQAVIRADVVNGLVTDSADIFGNVTVLPPTSGGMVVECPEDDEAYVRITGDKTGSSKSEMFVGQTIQTGGGLASDTGNGVHLFNTTTTDGVIVTATNQPGTKDWSFTGNIVLTAPNGTLYAISVDNSGTLQTTPIA